MYTNDDYISGAAIMGAWHEVELWLKEGGCRLRTNGIVSVLCAIAQQRTRSGRSVITHSWKSLRVVVVLATRSRTYLGAVKWKVFPFLGGFVRRGATLRVLDRDGSIVVMLW